MLPTVFRAGVMCGNILRTTSVISRQEFSHIWQAADFFGVGIGNGFLKQVAASESDLVFGLVSEEMGVIVAFTLAVAVGAMFIYARAITTRSRSTFYSISACCAAGLFVVQLSLNVFGATDVLPLTGVTFPFVSAGGSSIMSCWGLVAFHQSLQTRELIR